MTATSVTAAGLRCVIVGGRGGVGRMFADALDARGADVRLVDTRSPAQPDERFVPGDITRIDAGLARELGGADVVLLAVPESVALAGFTGTVRAMRPGTLVVDTLSVKTQIVELARTEAGGLQALSLNPMFAPELGMAGRPVAAVVMHDGPLARTLLRLISADGAQVTELTAQRHDQLAAAMQALTHAAVLAFGLALGELGVDLTQVRRLAPPPHATMLSLLARIACGTPQTYWDVQAANPWAARARESMAAGVARLAGIVQAGDETGFAALLGQLRILLGPDLDHHRQACARAFQHIGLAPQTEET